MSRKTTKNVSLTPQLAQYVDGCVARGNYDNASEVVREALRLMQQRDENLAQIRAMIEEGHRDVVNGNMTDGEVVMKRLKTRLKGLSHRKTA